jgi:signal transduction histidine kinase
VSDFGAGFKLETALTEPGLGLISMQERVQLMEGTLLIESQPERGTTIHVRVPVRSGNDSMRKVN